MRSILAVTDLQPGSDGVLSTAAALALRSGAALHLMHPMPVLGMPLSEAVRTDVGRRIRDAECALAAQVRRALPEGCAPASCTLHFQGVRESVRLRAREAGADLVVIAGEGGAAAMLAECAGAAAVPCLLVRNPLEHPPQRVLLPLSAAEAGQGVLADACDWLTSAAGAACAELRILHVASGPRQWRDLAPGLDREARWAGEQRPWNTRLRFVRSIRWGVAADVEILRVAEEEASDLVVLGPGCGVADSPVDPRCARAALPGRLPCSVLLLPGTLRPGEETGTSAEPAPFAGARPEPDVELAAAAD